MFPPTPYCDKHRLGTCCGEKHHVAESRLHATPKALYKAVVDATTDEARAAARAAHEEYDGSNGVCTSCQQKTHADGGVAAKKGGSAGRTCYFPGCDGTTGRPMGNVPGYNFCGSKENRCIKRALDYEAVHGKKPERVPWAEFYRPSSS